MEKNGNLCAHYAMTTLKETAVAGGYGDCVSLNFQAVLANIKSAK